MIKKIGLIIFCVLVIIALLFQNTWVRLYQGFKLDHISLARTKYYQLNNNTPIKDITQKLIADTSIPHELIQALIDGERRIVIFKYLSDKNIVAGYFSYITKGNHPLLIFLRGGNGYMGIMRPNNPFSFFKGYNVVGTLYRGNIYGGDDQIGGNDIDDVENLIKYFPQLETFTHVKLQSPYSMMGISRGAMEMFIALSRSNYVKQRVNHAISVSGNLDLQISMDKRFEMKYLFQHHFKKSHSQDFDKWLNIRNPVSNVANLSKSLDVLLIYGSSDNRVSLDEQKSFQKALQNEGIKINLFIIPGADHGLTGNYNEALRYGSCDLPPLCLLSNNN